jgi:hypothetical protein
MRFTKDLLGDLKDPRWIHVKGCLFFILALIASAGIIIQNPTLQNFALVAIALWSASRWYYYMFYVIERYVDPSFKFAGLFSVVKFLLGGRSKN